MKDPRLSEILILNGNCGILNKVLKKTWFIFHFRSVTNTEYPYNSYPPYCEGVFYLMSKKTMVRLIHLFEQEFHRNYIWIEDVFLTGILPMLDDIPLKDLSELTYQNVPIFFYEEDKTLAILTSSKCKQIR